MDVHDILLSVQTIGVNYRNRLSFGYCSGENLANCYSPDVFGILLICYQHL